MLAKERKCLHAHFFTYASVRGVQVAPPYESTRAERKHKYRWLIGEYPLLEICGIAAFVQAVLDSMHRVHHFTNLSRKSLRVHDCGSRCHALCGVSRERACSLPLLCLRAAASLLSQTSLPILCCCCGSLFFPCPLRFLSVPRPVGVVLVCHFTLCLHTHSTSTRAVYAPLPRYDQPRFLCFFLFRSFDRIIGWALVASYADVD